MMRRGREEKGMALLVVLVVIAVLSTLLVELAYSTLVDLRLTETFRDTTKAYYLAKGGINAGRMIIQDDQNSYDGLNEAWSQGVVNYPVADGAVTIQIQDQDGKLGVNALVNDNTPSTLMVDRFYRLFGTLDIVELADPAELTAALVDWLDTGSEPYERLLTDGANLPVAGAESSYYQGLSQPYKVKNGRLETLEELGLVKGFSPEVLKRVLPHIGVHEQMAVNINTASVEVLMSLDLAIDFGVAEEIVSYRKKNPIKTIEQLEEVVPELAYSALKTLGNLGHLGVSSKRYQIEADAVVNDGRRRLLAEVDKQSKTMLFFKVN